MKARLIVTGFLALALGTFADEVVDSVKWRELASWKCARSISIEPLPVTGEFSGPRSQGEYDRNFSEQLMSGLKGSGGFERGELLAAGQAPTTDLVIEGEFAELSTGSRAKRFWVGFGAGRAKCEVTLRCYRVSDHALVFELEHARVSAVGLKEDELQENIDAVVEDILAVLTSTRPGCAQHAAQAPTVEADPKTATPSVEPLQPLPPQPPLPPPAETTPAK